MILSNFSPAIRIKNIEYDGIILSKQYSIKPLTENLEQSYIVINSIYKESTNAIVKCKYTLYDLGKRYVIKLYGNSDGGVSPCKEYYNYAKEQEFDDIFCDVKSKYFII